MNRKRMWLALATAAWLPLTAAAAPAPPPPSEGPITDALALRGILPATAPPSAATAVTAGEGVIELQSLVMVPVEKVMTDTVTQPDGKKVQIERVVTTTEFTIRSVQWKADALKFYLVAKNGKLESVSVAKATAMLKEKKPVLTGDGDEVDARNLEVVKPGTLYLVLPPPQQEPTPIPIPPGLPPGFKP